VRRKYPHFRSIDVSDINYYNNILVPFVNKSIFLPRCLFANVYVFLLFFYTCSLETSTTLETYSSPYVYPTLSTSSSKAKTATVLDGIYAWKLAGRPLCAVESAKYLLSWCVDKLS